MFHRFEIPLLQVREGDLLLHNLLLQQVHFPLHLFEQSSGLLLMDVRVEERFSNGAVDWFAMSDLIYLVPNSIDIHSSI